MDLLIYGWTKLSYFQYVIWRKKENSFPRIFMNNLMVSIDKTWSSLVLLSFSSYTKG